MKETIFARYYMCAQMRRDACAEMIPYRDVPHRDDRSLLQKSPMKETIFARYYMCAQMGADMCAEAIP